MAQATTRRRRRPRGEGSLYQLPSGRWRGAIIVTDPATGGRIRRVVTGRTQGEARDRLDNLRHDLEQGADGSTLPLREYAARWLDRHCADVRPRTREGYRSHLDRHLLPALGGTALRDLTARDVERLTGALTARGLSGATARSVRTTLGKLLRDAERDGLVIRNAARLARPPRLDRTEMRVLSPEQTRRLIAGTATDEYGPLIAVAATTGLRQGELLALTWADVDLGERPSLTVRRALARMPGNTYALADTKTARSRRTLVLPPTAADALREQRDRQDRERADAGDLWQNVAGLVFADAIGRHVPPWHVSKSFRAALARLGLPAVRFHDLRHGVASMLLAQGVPLKLVSDMLGHSTITITADTYAHLDREQRSAAATAIEQALGGQS